MFYLNRSCADQNLTLGLIFFVASCFIRHMQQYAECNHVLPELPTVEPKASGSADLRGLFIDKEGAILPPPVAPLPGIGTEGIEEFNEGVKISLLIKTVIF